MGKYVRFMSAKEFWKYLEGGKLINNTDWRKQAQCTDSIGFCFFDDLVPPEKRMEYLSGVVDMEVVAVFETEQRMMESCGRYRDPDNDASDNLLDALFAPVQMMNVKEYSTKKYSRETMKLVKYGFPNVWNHRIEWQDMRELQLLEEKREKD